MEPYLYQHAFLKFRVAKSSFKISASPTYHVDLTTEHLERPNYEDRQGAAPTHRDLSFKMYATRNYNRILGGKVMSQRLFSFVSAIPQILPTFHQASRHVRA
uniref:Uncharacterized protein n=1 Tax=Cyanoptyche gloeocystis TaxID=77922 RepID=A0A7S2JNE7_9EUKA|mmetsp:Transcript_2043/g.3837  ORF Transcript_2043/g.3837 Transcript_2043/m.3837 type:complete len:102 (+) Transcript_2043:755-1060(+)